VKLKCLLVDDEPPALRVLESYIRHIDNLEIAGKCHNAFEARKLLGEIPIDLLFLDIRMPKLLGTEFLRTLSHPPKVIFTTAYKHYAIEGFELDAVDYLEKPFSLERFIKAVNKVNRRSEPLSRNIAETEGVSAGNNAYLYFRSERKMVKVGLDEIVYIESLKDYLKIVRLGAKALIVKKSMHSMEAMLPENKFMRVHRSFIIAVDRVTAYTPNDVEINGQEIPIGKLYSHRVAKILGA
jgi:DNA-binding LytR/AlgR family response regulator